MPEKEQPITSKIEIKTETVSHFLKTKGKSVTENVENKGEKVLLTRNGRFAFLITPLEDKTVVSQKVKAVVENYKPEKSDKSYSPEEIANKLQINLSENTNKSKKK